MSYRVFIIVFEGLQREIVNAVLQRIVSNLVGQSLLLVDADVEERRNHLQIANRNTNESRQQVLAAKLHHEYLEFRSRFQRIRQDVE